MCIFSLFAWRAQAAGESGEPGTAERKTGGLRLSYSNCIMKYTDKSDSILWEHFVVWWETVQEVSCNYVTLNVLQPVSWDQQVSVNTSYTDWTASIYWITLVFTNSWGKSGSSVAWLRSVYQLIALSICGLLLSRQCTVSFSSFLADTKLLAAAKKTSKQTNKKNSSNKALVVNEPQQ